MSNIVFVPEYDENVIEYVIDGAPGTSANVSKYWCLMPASANLLATLLADLKPVITEGLPWPARGPFAFNKNVPLIAFTLPDGTVVHRNAGQVAIYWTWAEAGNYPIDQALVYARADISGSSWPSFV